MTRVVMPPLGDAEDAASVAHWYKQEGDPVVKGEPLFQVETGKVSIDVEALGSGVLRRIIVAEGEDAEIGEILAYIGDPDDELPTA